MSDVNTIAVIDDDFEQRALVVRPLARALQACRVDKPGRWRVKGFAPPLNIEEFHALLTDEKVCVLLLDERLDGKFVGRHVSRTKKSVAYHGSKVVTFLAPRDWDLPMYLFSAVPDDANAQSVKSRVRKILGRNELDNPGAARLIPELVREGVRYLEQWERKHARLSSLAALAAQGRLTESESIEAEALRRGVLLAVDLSEAASPAVLQSRSELIAKLENTVGRIEQLLLPQSAPTRRSRKKSS